MSLCIIIRLSRLVGELAQIGPLAGGMHSQLLSVSIAIVHQCLGCLNDLLVQFSNLLDTNAGFNFSHVSKIGRILADLTDKADTMFGGFIVTDLFMNLLNGVISIFLAVGMAGIYGDKVTPGSVLFSISFLMLTIFSVYRIYFLQKFGQNIANSFSTIR